MTTQSSDEEYDKKDPFGKYAHDTHWTEHSRNKGHYCLDWDGLWICEDCSEFECCQCYSEQKEPVE